MLSPLIFRPYIQSTSQKLQDQEAKQWGEVNCSQQRRNNASEQVEIGVSDLQPVHTRSALIRYRPFTKDGDRLHSLLGQSQQRGTLTSYISDVSSKYTWRSANHGCLSQPKAGNQLSRTRRNRNKRYNCSRLTYVMPQSNGISMHPGSC